MANQLIKINNIFLKTREDDINIFRRIGTEGFTLYTYFLYEQSNNNSVNISIKMIQTFLTRNYDKRPMLDYKKRQCQIGVLKSKPTIILYIKALLKNDFITIKNLDDIYKKHNNNLDSININEILIISCNNITNNKFTLIPSNLFLDYIHRIGHIGWSLLVILSNLHNESFGGEQSCGFANPSQEYLSNTINKGTTAIKAYLCLLEKLRLIKIEPQEKITINTPHGQVDTYLANHYIVKWKLTENKYYILIKKKTKKDKDDEE